MRYMILLLLMALCGEALGQDYNVPFRRRASGFTDVPNASTSYVAFSVARRLLGSYSGNLIQVRRASDNTNQDIGILGDTLDVTSLESFCSATDCFVEILYDQSGNARNATQTTDDADQPQIVASGTVLKTSNGRPAMSGDAIDDALLFTSTGAMTDFTVLLVTDANSTAGTGNAPLTANGTNNRVTLDQDEMRTRQSGDAYIVAVTGLTAMATWIVAGVREGSNTGEFYRNSTSEGTATDTTPSSFTLSSFGRENNTYWQEDISEVIIWTSDIGDTAIKATSDNQKTYYGL